MEKEKKEIYFISLRILYFQKLTFKSILGTTLTHPLLNDLIKAASPINLDVTTTRIIISQTQTLLFVDSFSKIYATYTEPYVFTSWKQISSVRKKIVESRHCLPGKEEEKRKERRRYPYTFPPYSCHVIYCTKGLTNLSPFAISLDARTTMFHEYFRLACLGCRRRETLFNNSSPFRKKKRKKKKEEEKKNCFTSLAIGYKDGWLFEQVVRCLR